MHSQSSQRLLILARHGESETNAANVFTGWFDAPLTRRGEEEARSLAHLVAHEGIAPGAVFTSALSRAISTAEIVLRELRRNNIQIISSAALDERDYGELTGLNKAEAAERFGGEQIRRWRRSWAEAPPRGESLRDTAARVLPYYLHEIQPAVMRGEDVLVIAHGNSLRALSMALEGLTPEDVEQLEFSTGGCRLYELAADTTVCRAALLHADTPTPNGIPKETAA